MLARPLAPTHLTISSTTLIHHHMCSLTTLIHHRMSTCLPVLSHLAVSPTTLTYHRTCKCACSATCPCPPCCLPHNRTCRCSPAHPPARAATLIRRQANVCPPILAHLSISPAILAHHYTHTHVPSPTSPSPSPLHISPSPTSLSPPPPSHHCTSVYSLAHPLSPPFSLPCPPPSPTATRVHEHAAHMYSPAHLIISPTAGTTIQACEHVHACRPSFLHVYVCLPACYQSVRNQQEHPNLHRASCWSRYANLLEDIYPSQDHVCDLYINPNHQFFDLLLASLNTVIKLVWFCISYIAHLLHYTNFATSLSERAHIGTQ